MSRALLGSLAAVAIALALPAVANENVREAPEVAPGLLELDTTQSPPAYSGRRMYVIELDEQPGISYTGDIDGYAATAPAKGASYNAKSGAVQMYSNRLKRIHDQKLASVGASDQKVYSYTHAMNGFAAMLTAGEAARLSRDKSVVTVIEDFAMDVDTNNSPDFLGLNDSRDGLRKRRKLRGEDVIVGILDTGAVPGHPSFADTRQFDLPAFCEDPTRPWQQRTCDVLIEKRSKVVYDEPPAQWNGACEEGEGWTTDDCNNKLIGARWYVDGFLAGRGSVVEGEFLSPRDSSGHGSHTASTAAGNHVTATFNGTPVAEISGMAPRARIAVYKVCWLSPGATNFSCFFSDSAAATDDAVADGVDVINFSIGTAQTFTDPQDLAFLRAASEGVFVARSAGNDGPGPFTTNAGSPWVTSVAASTLDGTGIATATRVNSPPSVAGLYPSLEGAITAPLVEVGPVTDDLVAADPLDACTPLANDIGGQIAFIARGACAFTVKIENAVNAGASAVLMYSDDRPKTVMGGTATALTLSIPGVMIDNAAGIELLQEIDSGATVNVTLSANEFIEETLTGNIMADFSSRGPYAPVDDWIKPDITAPGVRILAANTPDQADGSAGDLFGYLNGTSMSSPHIAGLGALLIEARPDWSPAQVKSALMTTARQNVVKEDGTTPADPFDFGAGHAEPNDAVNPSLTYDAGLLDYLAASCGTVTPLVSPEECAFVEDTLGLSTDPSDLNLPSIGIDGIPGSQTVTRTVTAVSRFRGRNAKPQGPNRPVTYTASIEAPEGFAVEVSPATLSLRPGESASYEMTVTNVDAPPDEWRFGAITWEGSGSWKGSPARSPIAVNAAAIVAPEEVFGEGASGTLEFPVTFGYNGDYNAGVHGLNDAGLTGLTVEDDPADNFVFLGDGVDIAFLEEFPEGTAFARFATFDEYTTGNDDIDLYLYYCPNFSCTLVDSSGNTSSDEEVSVTFPANDPSIPDPYLLFTHAFDTDDGTPAQIVVFDWSFGVVDDAGNMTVTAPTSATVGATETITVEWDGLDTGPGEKQLGAISHSDANGILDLTLINITNDPGGTICDLIACP